MKNPRRHHKGEKATQPIQTGDLVDDFSGQQINAPPYELPLKMGLKGGGKGQTNDNSKAESR